MCKGNDELEDPGNCGPASVKNERLGRREQVSRDHMIFAYYVIFGVAPEPRCILELLNFHHNVQAHIRFLSEPGKFPFIYDHK